MAGRFDIADSLAGLLWIAVEIAALSTHCVYSRHVCTECASKGRWVMNTSRTAVFGLLLLTCTEDSSTFLAWFYQASDVVPRQRCKNWGEGRNTPECIPSVWSLLECGYHMVCPPTFGTYDWGIISGALFCEAELLDDLAYNLLIYIYGCAC